MFAQRWRWPAAAIAFLLMALAPSGGGAQPWVSADAAVLVDADSGQVLYDRAGGEWRDPASTTKMMTALLIIESGRLDEMVEVSSRAASAPGSAMGLRRGDRLLLVDLLKGILICSGNDAAVAAAEHLAGSEEHFVELMNQRARELRLLATHYRNPHGLTASGHKTTARDLAALARYCLRHPLFRHVVSLREAVVEVCDRRGTPRQIALSTTNRLLGMGYDVDGVKTGTTYAAGRCLVASLWRGDRRLVAVVLHSNDRWGDALRLFDYGCEEFWMETLLHGGEIAGSLPLANGLKPAVAVVTADGVRVARRGDVSPENPFSVVIQTTQGIVAPVAKGQEVGWLVARDQDGCVLKVRLLAAETVGRDTLLGRLLLYLLPAVKALARRGVG
ncbi:MAG: D-alanyl-D-alanine carboxypeptidase family protein [Bacillota bacterium]